MHSHQYYVFVFNFYRPSDSKTGELKYPSWDRFGRKDVLFNFPFASLLNRKLFNMWQVSPMCICTPRERILVEERTPLT